MLTEIEAFRALARYAPDAVSPLPAVLDQIDLIDLDPAIRILARTIKPVTVCSPGCHSPRHGLALPPGLTSFVTYDKRLLDAAQTAGLPVGLPAATLPGWLKRGWASGRQDTRAPYRWIITADSAEVERLRALHQLPAGYHNRRRWTDTGIPIDTPKDKDPDNHAREDLRNSH